MISYSPRDMQRQLISDQRLWKRLPGSTAAILLPLEAILLGWDTTEWAGLVTILAATILSVVIPPRLSVSLYLIDLLDRTLKLPLWLGWLALAWHLSVREPIFPVLGSPWAGAIIVTALSWSLTTILVLVATIAARRILIRDRAARA